MIANRLESAYLAGRRKSKKPEFDRHKLLYSFVGITAVVVGITLVLATVIPVYLHGEPLEPMSQFLLELGISLGTVAVGLWHYYTPRLE